MHTTPRACPACLADTNGLIGSVKPTAHGNYSTEDFSLALCQRCQTVYLNPLPTPDDFVEMYEKQLQFDDPTYTDSERIQAIVGYMSSCLKRIVSTQKKRCTVRVMEFGAGYAWMCRAAKQSDPLALTIAQDVSAEVSNQCSWVDRYIVADMMSECFDAYRDIDVISLTHVLEHLSDPIAALQRCKHFIARTGTVFVTAPHCPIGDSSKIRSHIEPWLSYSYLHVPAHLQYFSKGGMQELAALAGYQLSYWDAKHEGGEAFEAWLTPV